MFMISGSMAAVGGNFAASRISSASQATGQSNVLMMAIAAAVIGGTSLFGGRGSTYSALLGMLVIQSIASGMAGGSEQLDPVHGHRCGPARRRRHRLGLAHRCTRSCGRPSTGPTFPGQFRYHEDRGDGALVVIPHHFPPASYR